jgi:ribosome-binding protein aMBF1 (putative translation factor)
MIYPDVPVDKWIKKYDLKIYHRQCPHCSVTVSTNRPWITVDYAGIELEYCPSCNKKIGMSVAVPISEKSKTAWGSL